MGIYLKVKAVERVFDALEKEIKLFQQESQLSCLPSCGKCCSKADIEATILEFLPFAYHLYKEQRALECLDKLENHNSPVCVLLNPFLGQNEKGFCSVYKHRGLICRLFGFSARTDKNGNKNLVTCALIKGEQPAAYDIASAQVFSGEMRIPLMNNYAMMLYAIDAQLASNYYPINEAIRLAIETVLSYYSYRSNAG